MGNLAPPYRSRCPCPADRAPIRRASTSQSTIRIMPNRSSR